jgi:hypothetical protein
MTFTAECERLRDYRHYCWKSFSIIRVNKFYLTLRDATARKWDWFATIIIALKLKLN